MARYGGAVLMAVLAPTITEAEEIGSPVTHIRVKWNDPAYGTANAATGFKLIHDDETGTLPAWTSAIDAALAGGGDGAGNFEVLLPVPLGGVAAWWETFEEYAVGAIDASIMSAGGNVWNGSWGSAEPDIGYRGFGDSFESYPVGVQTESMNGGTGWSGPWAD